MAVAAAAAAAAVAASIVVLFHVQGREVEMDEWPGIYMGAVEGEGLTACSMWH